MTVIAKTLLIYLGLVLVVFVWMFRFDTTSGGTGTAVISDRWFGTVETCAIGGVCYHIYPVIRK